MRLIAWGTLTGCPGIFARQVHVAFGGEPLVARAIPATNTHAASAGRVAFTSLALIALSLPQDDKSSRLPRTGKDFSNHLSRNPRLDRCASRRLRMTRTRSTLNRNFLSRRTSAPCDPTSQL